MFLKRLHVFFLVVGMVGASLIINPQQASAQEEGKHLSIPLDHFYADPTNTSGLRKILSKIHWSFSTGYGRTFYSQDLSEFSLLQQPDSLPIIFDGKSDVVGGRGYAYWFNTVVNRDNVSNNNPENFAVNGDTTDLKFKAPGHSIPLNLTLHYEFDRYKIGAGFNFEYHRPGTFAPNVYKDQISSYEPNFGSAFYKKYYLILGARVYRYYAYNIVVDAQVGAFALSKKFDKEFVNKGVYFNIGTTFERQMSEYFRVFVRPSFDIKSFKVNLPESSGLQVNHSMNAAYLNFGITYRIPELRKCVLKQCTTQINHQHGDKLYRSRVHPIYKKQNPHHGENYPVLIKYKGKNKKKMHPY